MLHAILQGVGIILACLYAGTVMLAAFVGTLPRSELALLIGWPVIVPVWLVLALINPFMIVFGCKYTPRDRLVDYLSNLN